MPQALAKGNDTGWRQAIALRLIGAAVAGACTMLAPALHAQPVPISEGHYVMDGGSYAITVDRTADGIMVHEPNKDSAYRQGAEGEYSFYNGNTGSTFGIRVVDARTIEVYRKDPPGNSASRMTLVGEPPVRDANDPAAIAVKYRDLARTDPANAQSWTFCSAAALKRSQATGAEADAYAIKSAQALGLIIVDRTTSPCPDAIAQPLWTGALADAPPPAGRPAQTAPSRDTASAAVQAAETAERERLNGESAAKAAADAERFRRMKEQQAADQAAYAQAQAQFAQDRAAYEKQVAEAKAAADAYERAMADYRGRTGQKP